MNTLELKENGIIGSKEAVLELEKKDSARILILSDSHGSYEKVRAIITGYASECDAVVFCGDCMMDISVLVTEASADTDFCSLLPPVIFYVRGNTDSVFCPVRFFIPNAKFLKTKYKNLSLPESLVFKACGRSFYAVHGHLQHVNAGYSTLAAEAKKNGCCCAFFGHTHVSMNTVLDDVYIVNPGSCAFPRSSQTERFAIATVTASFVDIAEIAKTDGKFSVCR